MNRREVIVAGAATSLAHLVSVVSGCAAQTANAPSTLPTPASGDARAALQRAAAECVRAGEACLSHCIRSLSSGSTMMAACAAKARVMLAICRAVETLATTDSAHLPALARICAAACTECAEACGAHASHHAECAECERACRATIAAAQAVAG
jgi:Cys-rich four helix bundle protein (predicted Tat secretion target)